MKLPLYCLVGARPVKMVPTPDGGADVLAYDWKTGDFVREMDYLTRILGADPDVDPVSEEDFEREVARLRTAM